MSGTPGATGKLARKFNIKSYGINLDFDNNISSLKHVIKNLVYCVYTNLICITYNRINWIFY